MNEYILGTTKQRMVFCIQAIANPFFSYHPSRVNKTTNEYKGRIKAISLGLCIPRLAVFYIRKKASGIANENWHSCQESHMTNLLKTHSLPGVWLLLWMWIIHKGQTHRSVRTQHDWLHTNPTWPVNYLSKEYNSPYNVPASELVHIWIHVF